jgi:MbtH protein
MSEDNSDDGTIFVAVVNDEEQYSIWRADTDLPLGWRATGTRGTKQECLSYIETVWTDMRPASLRRHMESGKAKP